MVLGQGNGAMETAQELQRYTTEVHLHARGRALPQGGSGVRLAYQTHYAAWKATSGAGDARSVTFERGGPPS